MRNTGLGFITGTFTGLAHGQVVPLTFGGTTYKFVANYHGGRYGRDLVLTWAKNRVFAWGDLVKQSGYGSRNLATPVEFLGRERALRGHLTSSESAARQRP